MGILDRLDYDVSIKDKDTYERELAELQLRILDAELHTREAGRQVIIAFEGWDASGKGGAIKRLTEKLDPRGYAVFPIGAPTEEERRHHYLWRFWTRLPSRGRWAIFDRAWYGRVLVERQLVDDGAVLVKLFLATTKDEQARRFDEREKNPYKRWKIGPEDWRNREHWDEYVEAAEDMFAETSTDVAPWKVIGANRKLHTRLTVIRHVLGAIEDAVPTDE